MQRITSSTLAVTAVLTALVPVVGAAPAAHAVPSGCVSQVFSAGSRAECVKNVQAILNYSQFRRDQPAIAVDGVFGQATDARVRILQRDWRITADGVVGRGTWGILCAGSALTPVQQRAGCASLPR